MSRAWKSVIRAALAPLHFNDRHFPMSSFRVLRQNGRLVAFGFFMCFCSSVGQTFFISLFNGEIRRSFGLGHGDIGAMYAAGTVTSAATLMFAGRLIDRTRLSRVVVLVLGGLACAAAAMGLVWSAIGLPFVFYGLRFFGQGLASHTGMTAMGRYFNAARGRVISLAALGYSAGEALLPAAVVACLAVVGWQSLWLTIAATVVLAIPLGLFLLSGPMPREADGDDAVSRERAAPDWPLGAVLADRSFWLRMPTLLAPPFIATGLFFHQVRLAEEKGWPLQLMAGAFTAFAVASILTSLMAGPTVDRLSARRLWPWVLLPMAASCAVLAALAASWAALLFMVLIGISTGLFGVAGNALWPELYGTRHLGAIKAFMQSAMVLASGLAPVVFGLLIDRDVGMNRIAVACGAWCLLAAALAVLASPRAGEVNRRR